MSVNNYLDRSKNRLRLSAEIKKIFDKKPTEKTEE